MHKSTLDPDEVKKFTDISNAWWDQEGPFKQLHLMNRVRIPYIKNILFQQSISDGQFLNGLRIIDVGCGGGILSIPLSKLGASVTGLDASIENIAIANHYAKNNGHNIDYVHSTIEEFVVKKSYDVVCALEIVEHVADVNLFLESVVSTIRPGGIIFVSTINQTLKSYAQAILIAEYALRIVPVGTHKWSKFIKPSTIAEIFADNNMQLIDMKGMKLNIFMNEWYLDDNVDVNYIMAFKKI